jgi:predicted acetyltransferase
VVGAHLDLRLRPLEAGDEAAAVAAHEELAADGFTFLQGYDPGAPWEDHLQLVDDGRRGVHRAPGRVRCSFLVADVAGEIVGRASIRHELNPYLSIVGGHIGYGVRPRHRRRGVATEILRQSLVVVRASGVRDVLVTCDEGNIGSTRTIERCGGTYESTVQDPADGTDVRRYWFR